MIGDWKTEGLGARAASRDEAELRTDLAVARLQAACLAFACLAKQAGVSGAALLHATAAALHTFAAAIEACETANVEAALIRAHVAPLRALHGLSPFVRRLQTWPRGYPGDFETVEWMCDAANRAPVNTVEWAIEQYALQSPIAQQHRNKVALQARAILSTLIEEPNARIASIGCGGCRDLSMVQSYVPAGRAAFVLVDGDDAALSFARQRLGRIANRCVTVHGRVPRALPLIAAHGPFHLVVAGGLFDYLSDRWAIATLREMRLLAPGGRVLFSNIAAGNPFRTWLEYLADWRLIEREPADLERLLAAAGFAGWRTTVITDSSGLALIADIRDGSGETSHARVADAQVL
jgi:extracellular factor (EF) 3-hydroxypalmitic acid methyl ester biosynthesis protein